MNTLIRILLLAVALVSFARADEMKEKACTCPTGGACTCPEGKCTCGEKKETAACTCETGGACTCPEGKCTCSADEKAATSMGHPLKGVIVEVLAAKNAVLVKHEEIPGVMKAMTMLFQVDEATLASVKKGDAITARMTNEDGTFRLHDVKLAK